MNSEIRAQGSDLRKIEGQMGKSYQDLKIWPHAIQLSVAVYKLTGQFPTDERFGLTSQLRRAAVFVASNIAEGYGRASKGKFRQFVGMASGSVLELQTQLVIAKELGFSNNLEMATTENLVEETGKMTWALLQKL